MHRSSRLTAGRRPSYCHRLALELDVDRTLHTACTRDCPDACGIVATVRDGRVVAIAGDKHHPVTRGFLCERTSRYLTRQYSPERLTHPLLRRDGVFVRTSWDEALDQVAGTLARIRAESGPEAVLHYRSGGSLAILKNLNDYFFECFGGARVKLGDVCAGAGEAAQVLDLGASESHAHDDLLNSRCILLWGKNVLTSFLHMLPEIKAARRRGAVVVLIDPVPQRTRQHVDLWVQPRPGADRFLALGMARVLYERGWVDGTLADWSVGAADFERLALARPVVEWARAADVPAAQLAELAELYGTRKPGNIQVGWGLQRRLHGGQTVRVLDALAALAGNFGVPGGGVTFYYRRRDAFHLAPYVAPKERRGIPEPLLGEGILAAQDPPVRAVVVDNGNPVAMLPDSQRVAAALRSRELVVVLEQFMTDTAACADVVLPVTTMLEEADLLGAFGHHHLIATQPVAARPPEAKTDLEIYQALAERLGFGDKLRGTPEEWSERLLARLRGQVDLDMLRRGAVRNPLAPPVLYAGRRFPTADGRFHFVTEVDLQEPADDTEFPLQLASFSTPLAQSSQWSVPVDGEPLEARCHPHSAAGLADGARARLRSRVGALEVVLRHDPEMRRDLLLVPKGGWLRHGRAANALVSARATDFGLGAAYYDERVRLEPIGAEPTSAGTGSIGARRPEPRP
jgi:anaerobic selenocysteine-containing dehydrogenase